MKIGLIHVGWLQTNCYLISDDSGRCAVVDPGGDAERILQALKEQELRCEAILLTHGHDDHTGALEEVRKATGAKVYIGAGDADRLDVPADVILSGGEKVRAGDLSFDVTAVPGHTPGGLLYICGDVMVAGDTLFHGSIGRTDLPGGDMKTMQDTLRLIRDLPYEDLMVLPGHGETTTLAFERRFNPFFP